jgi:quinol monooxygenase YgiN
VRLLLKWVSNIRSILQGYSNNASVSHRMNTGYLINKIIQMKFNKESLPSFILFTLIISFVLNTKVSAQENKQTVRMAKLVIDSAQLENYKIALKEQMQTAINTEPGVLLYNAVYEKNNQTHITILEVYANDSAYLAHRETLHFKKYKATVKDMVKSFELIDAVPIGLASKLK